MICAACHLVRYVLAGWIAVTAEDEKHFYQTWQNVQGRVVLVTVPIDSLEFDRWRREARKYGCDSLIRCRRTESPE